MAAIGKGVSEDEQFEDYWASSTATKIKAKGVNIFDESVDLASAKKLVQSGSFGDYDNEADCLGGDDYVSSSASSCKVEYIKSARYRTPERPQLPQSLPSSGPRTSFTSSDPHQQRSPEPSIEDIVQKVPLRQPSITDVAKLEAEIQRLKRLLDSSRKDPKDTVLRIIFGKPYSLEVYKSKDDKVALLNEAIRLSDGNAITAAILFMRDTLNKSMYQRELMQRPLAIDHLISYLQQHGDWQELGDLLSMLGRTEEAAFIKYRQSITPKQPESKIKSLKNCYTTHFQTDPLLSHDASLIQEQIQLLEMQLPVEDADFKAAKMSGQQSQSSFLVGQSVIGTLYYCCRYHYGLAENSFASPTALRNNHKLTAKQYTWTAMRARGHAKSWDDIEALFTSKNWFGSTKMKPVIGFDKVVAELFKMKAPRESLNKFCALISDTDERLEIAGKYNCPETIVDTYKDMKDRQALRIFAEKLKPNSQEWYYARDALQASTVKWKN